MLFMDEEKKKRKKKPVDAGDGGHKKPWQETYATPEEIKAMLSERVMLLSRSTPSSRTATPSSR